MADTDNLKPVNEREAAPIVPKSEWSFSNIDIGGGVDFNIAGVDDSFVKLTGNLKKSESSCAFFVNLNGVASVKQKFHPGADIIIIHGNRSYFTKIIELKAMILSVVNPPYKVITARNKRSHNRYDCNIPAMTLVDQRGVQKEKRVFIKNISREGCCVAIQRTKDEMATGLSVGKILTVFIEMKGQLISFPGIIRNVRKDNENDSIKYAGVEFKDLSPMAHETVSALIARLEQVTSSKQ